MEPQLAQCRLTEVSLEPGKDWHWSWWAEEPLACVLEKAYCPSQTEQQKLIQSLGLGNRLWDIRAPLHSSLELTHLLHKWRGSPGKHGQAAFI